MEAQSCTPATRAEGKKIMHRPKLRTLPAALTASLAVMAGGAHAQTVAQKPTVLPEVSVSATRVERDNMDIPASIDTIDQRTIREANPQVNLSEALNRVPGIVVQNRQNYAQDLQISSRGFGARSTFGVRGLRLIADGIPATMPDGQGQAASFNLSSARSIEVLRGPFASLYGNSAGGVVQIFTADGPAVPTFSLNALYGSYGTYKLGANYGGQHGPLNIVIDASRFETNGYRDHSSARRDHLNAKFKYDLGRAGVLTLVLNGLDQPETEDPLGLTAAQVAQNPKQALNASSVGGTATNAYSYNTRKSISQNQAGLTYDVLLGGGTKLNARVYGGDRQVTQHLAIPLNPTQNVNSSSGGVVDLDRGYGGAALRVTHENKLAGMPFTISGGVDYDRMKERRSGYLNNFGATGAIKRNEDNVVSNTDVYAQAEFQPIKDLSLLGGLRHSSVRFKSTDYFITTGNPNDSGAQDYSRTTPAFGATYKITPLLNVYANVGKGFETPTFAELAYRPGGATGLNFTLAPANSLHKEIGLKTLLGDHGRLNASIFRIDVTNEIVVNSNAGGRSDFKNAPGTRREGLELGWGHKFPMGFEAAISYTLLNARFTQSFTTAGVNVAGGNKLPGVAGSNLFGELVWRHASNGFYAGAEVRNSGKVWVNDQNSEFAGDYTVFNLKAGLQQRGSNWKLSEFVRLDNAGNKHYIGSVIVAEANNRYYEPAPGRNYMFGINAEFKF
jgi:iron complex outermembrane receptor protein